MQNDEYRNLTWERRSGNEHCYRYEPYHHDSRIRDAMSPSISNPSRGTRPIPVEKANVYYGSPFDLVPNRHVNDLRADENGTLKATWPAAEPSVESSAAAVKPLANVSIDVSADVSAERSAKPIYVHPARRLLPERECSLFDSKFGHDRKYLLALQLVTRLKHQMKHRRPSKGPLPSTCAKPVAFHNRTRYLISTQCPIVERKLPPVRSVTN